jgi:hypothetical protein
MFNKMNEQKAVTNTQEASKGRELFGNWELSDELDDADLMAVAGGGDGELSLAVNGGDFRVERVRVSVVQIDGIDASTEGFDVDS